MIGTVEAALAGGSARDCAVGDRVLAVAGEPVRWWDDVEEPLRARPDQEVAISRRSAATRRST